MLNQLFIMLRPTDIPKKKLLLLKQTPESITTTLKYLETIRARELTQIKEAVFLFSLEMWPCLALDSSFGCGAVAAVGLGTGAVSKIVSGYLDPEVRQFDLKRTFDDLDEKIEEHNAKVLRILENTLEECHKCSSKKTVENSTQTEPNFKDSVICPLCGSEVKRKFFKKHCDRHH